MIDKETKTRMGELRESGLTIKQTALALEVSESTVKKYSSDDPDKDNELDEKISDEMTKIMLLEGYDFEDEIKPLIYALKDEVNIMDITLWNHINDIKNNTNTFLRLTDNPIRLYYIFMLFASNLNLITDHIEPKTLIEVIDNFIDREVSMEEADKYLAESKTEREDILAELKKMYNENQKRIEKTKRDCKKKIEITSETILKNSKEDLKEYKEKIDNAKKDLNSFNIARTVLIEELEKAKKIKIENQALKSEDIELRKLLEQTNKENSLLKEAFKKINQEAPALLKEFEKIKQENYLLKKGFMNKLNFRFFPKR